MAQFHELLHLCDDPQFSVLPGTRDCVTGANVPACAQQQQTHHNCAASTSQSFHIIRSLMAQNRCFIESLLHLHVDTNFCAARNTRSRHWRKCACVPPATVNASSPTPRQSCWWRRRCGAMARACHCSAKAHSLSGLCTASSFESLLKNRVLQKH